MCIYPSRNNIRPKLFLPECIIRDAIREHFSGTKIILDNKRKTFIFWYMKELYDNEM